MSTPGKRTNGNTGVFTNTPATSRSSSWPSCDNVLPGHHERRDFRQRHAGRLRQVRHRARRARVHLEHVHHIVLHGVLDVHEADDLQRARDAARVVANRRQMPLGDEIGRHDARAVAGVDARLLDVLHDAADDDRARFVRDRIHVELERVFDELVDQDRMLGRRVNRIRHVAIERAHVVHDGHPPPAEHVGRPHDDREPDLLRRPRALRRATWRCRSTGCGMPRSHSSCEKRWRSSARSIESGDVPRILTPAACSASDSFSGVWPPNCTRHATSPPACRLAIDHGHDVFERQRLEIQPIGRVVVGRHGFRVAVDHDRLEPRVAQRERRVTAAVIELEPLPNAVRAAAENDDLRLVRRVRLVASSRTCCTCKA